MNLVLQRGRSDCAVAVLAMVADLPWEAANHLLRRDRNAHGTPTAALVRILGELGLQAERGGGGPGFARIHYGESHLVAVRADGVILDPAGMPPRWWPDIGGALPRIDSAPHVREVWRLIPPATNSVL